MKQICAAALCLCFLLSACGQADSSLSNQKTAGTQDGETNTAAFNTASRQEASKFNEPALCFNGEMPDPQSMAPTYKSGTLSFEGTLTPGEGGEYEAALHLTRYFPQGANLMTGEPQPDCYMTFDYDSVGSAEPSEISKDAMAVLEKLSEGDGGQRQYGLLTMRTRGVQNTIFTTTYCLLDAPSLVAYSSTLEVPYLLTTQGDSAALYLQLSSLAAVKLEGRLTLPPMPERQDLKSAQMLFFNDEGRTPEQDKLKDVWNILFLGEKSGESYNGTLRLWSWRERSGEYPTNLWCVPGDVNEYEKEISLEFTPFSETEYLAEGGCMNARDRAGLSAMAMVDCGGKTVLFTACGDRVFAELPDVPIGVLTGRFSDDLGLVRIHDECLNLCRLENSFHSATPNPTPDGFNLGTEGIDSAAASGIEEHKKVSFGAPDGVPTWMPEEFVSMIRPTHLVEKRPTTLGSAYFQYTEDGYWLEDVEPRYREKLAGMRELQFEIGDDGFGPVMEIVFRYGERSVVIKSQETPIGTFILASVY